MRKRFPEILESTQWHQEKKDNTTTLLCVHHCCEGATVGPSDYTFRNAEDVIRHCDIPQDIAAVLSGHIHRHQVLTLGLNKRPLKTPVLYPGSIERTSFAEMNEKKGCLHIILQNRTPGQKANLSWKFKEFDSRPMVRLRIQAGHLTIAALFEHLNRRINRLQPHSIVRLLIDGPVKQECLSILKAESLRRMCPREMNISIRFIN